MDNPTIQELFDTFEALNKKVDKLTLELSAIEFEDHSDKEFISAEEAEQYLIDVAAFEARQKEVEEITKEVKRIGDLLTDKLCRVNTKVKVFDKEVNSEVLVYCSNGSIIVEDMQTEDKAVIIE